MALDRWAREPYLYTHKSGSELDLSKERVIKIDRIIMSDCNGIYSVHYEICHLCETSKALKLSILRTEYNEDGVMCSKSPLRLWSTDELTDIKAVINEISDWGDNLCKCDGGYSSYKYSATRIRKKLLS